MLGAALIAFRDGRVPPNAVSSEFILSKKGGAEGGEDADKTEIDLGTVGPTSATTSVVGIAITLTRCLYFFVTTSVVAVSSRVEILCLCQQRTLAHARDVQQHSGVAAHPMFLGVSTWVHPPTRSHYCCVLRSDVSLSVQIWPERSPRRHSTPCTLSASHSAGLRITTLHFTRGWSS
jgi:hypothetical protein